MAEAQYLLLTQPDRDLVNTINRDGPIECGRIPPISLSNSPNLDQIPARFPLALIFEYQPAQSPVPVNDIRSLLETFAIGLQLVRPVDEFSDFWLKINTETQRVLMRSASLVLPENLGGPTLQ